MVPTRDELGSRRRLRCAKPPPSAVTSSGPLASNSRRAPCGCTMSDADEYGIHLQGRSGGELCLAIADNTISASPSRGEYADVRDSGSEPRGAMAHGRQCAQLQRRLRAVCECARQRAGGLEPDREHQGTEEAPILFTSDRVQGATRPAGWGGLRIDGSAVPDLVKVEYGRLRIQLKASREGVVSAWTTARSGTTPATVWRWRSTIAPTFRLDPQFRNRAHRPGRRVALGDAGQLSARWGPGGRPHRRERRARSLCMRQRPHRRPDAGAGLIADQVSDDPGDGVWSTGRHASRCCEAAGLFG